MPKSKNVEIWRKSSSVINRKDRQRKADEQYIRESMKGALELCQKGEMHDIEMYELKKRR
jgi:hypothetical protein